MHSTKNLLRQLPPLDLLEESLINDPLSVLPDELLTGATPSEDAGGGGSRAIIGAGGAASAPLLASSAPSELRGTLVRDARRAINRLNRDGEDTELPPAEHLALEAIVVASGRPAILMMNGSFMAAPSGWEILDQVKPNIEQTARSVGRVEVTGHPTLEWIGTGFLVGKNALMTNRHVAKEFARQKSAKSWTFEPGMKARVDYREEIGSLDSLEYEITGIIGVHDKFDMALLRVAPKSSRADKLPPPLPVASRPPDTRKGRKVYVIGYPAWDGRRNDPDVMMRIFANVFNVKRLQPGELLEIYDDESLLDHDCSTLGGNSGSCVVDIETNQVIGLHFSGRYMQANKAVALWKLTDDPLLKKAKVTFV